MNIKRPVEMFTDINTGETINYEKKLKLHGTESLPPRRLRHGTEE
jgi:hypothetical protein